MLNEISGRSGEVYAVCAFQVAISLLCLTLCGCKVSERVTGLNNSNSQFRTAQRSTLVINPSMCPVHIEGYILTCV